MAIPSITKPERDWKRAAKAVIARRAELELTVRDCVQRAQGGISVETWSKLENPKGPRMSMAVRSLAAASRALGWSHDSLERILAGHEPFERGSVYGEEVDATELAFRGWSIEKQLRDLLFRQERLEAHLESVEGRLAALQGRLESVGGLVDDLQGLVQELRRGTAKETDGPRSVQPGRRSDRGKR